jgi:hypothetical protein
MATPSKARTPWPDAVMIGGIPAAISKRAINLDPQDVHDCDDALLLAPSSVIGTTSGDAVEWSQGPVAATQPRRVVSAAAAEAAVRGGAAVFLCRGSNFRMYTADAVAVSSPVSADHAASTGAPVALPDAEEPVSPDEGTGATRSRKQYTKAVAFEFVSNVLGNVLGEDQVPQVWGA